MGVNHVIKSSGDIILSLLGDTVTPETLLKGYTAHDASGEVITGTLETGSSEVKLATGTLTGINTSAAINVTFDTPLSAVPDIIFVWEATTSYYNAARTKAVLASKGYLFTSGTGQSYYRQVRWYGNTQNSTSASYNTSAMTTTSSVQGIYNATANGFSVKGYSSSSYYLRGTYNYLAVCL